MTTKDDFPRASREAEAAGVDSGSGRSAPAEPLSGHGRWIASAGFFLFAALVSVTAAMHEPWRDEGDAWLAVRDDTLSGIALRAAHAGTPILWYVMLKPLALAGFGFGSSVVLHVAIAALAAWLILFRSPFPLLLRLAIVFSYFLSFEYAVITRNYAIGVLLLFASAASYWSSLQRTRTGLLLGALVNTSVHALVIGAVLIAGHLVNHLREVRAGQRIRWWAIVVPLFGLLLACIQLYPRPGGQLPPRIAGAWNPEAINWALGGMILPRVEPDFPLLSTFSALLLILVAFLLPSGQMRLMYGMSVAGLLAIFVFSYAVEDGYRHFGFLWLVMIVFLWLGLEKNPITRKVHQVIVWVAILPLLYAAASAHWREFRYPFSGSTEAAQFLESNGLSRESMAISPSVLAGGLLPQIDREEPVFYPGEIRSGTYSLWNEALARSYSVLPEELLRRSEKAFPAGEPFLFIINAPLDGQVNGRLRLLFASSPEVWGRADERFFIYQVAGESGSEPAP
jgi:hypothetical protein